MIYQKDFIICPWCNGKTKSSIDHLYDEVIKWGPWYCDLCLHPYEGEVNGGKDLSIRKCLMMRPLFRTLSLLKICANEGDIYFVMEINSGYQDINQSPKTLAEIQDYNKYYFEEHSCPTNWIGDCVAIIQDSDTDPHGIMEFIKTVKIPLDFDLNKEKDLEKFFPEAFCIG
jgi:hypothetical protein